MASLHAITSQSFLPLSNHKPRCKTSTFSQIPKLCGNSQIFSRSKRKEWAVVRSIADGVDVLPVQSGDGTDQQEGLIVNRTGLEREEDELVSQVGGFATSEGQFAFDGFSSSVGEAIDAREYESKLADRILNATIVLAAGTFAITKLLTIDRDYWHGWTLYEILRYAPQHNWIAYEEALKTNPVFAKMVISGVVYSLGDWIAQCVEGKPLFEFDRARMFRSGLVGFTLHGSLSHFYYQFCEELFPFQDWWVVPAKVAFDQTAWSAVWNSIYYTVVALLRLESPATIFDELKATFWPMLTAGWKLWPFAHLITYGVIPLEQRLLWVDTIELIWVTILSTFSNEKSEARISEASEEANSSSPLKGYPEE